MDLLVRLRQFRREGEKYTDSELVYTWVWLDSLPTN